MIHRQKVWKNLKLLCCKANNVIQNYMHIKIYTTVKRYGDKVLYIWKEVSYAH